MKSRSWAETSEGPWNWSGVHMPKTQVPMMGCIQPVRTLTRVISDLGV